VLPQLQTAKILENDMPVFVISFRTQEILAFRSPASGELVEGDDNRIENCVYVAVLTRVDEEVGNELTGGWKIIDVSF
jgi:import inner membrane translocase subunit TIM44